LQWIDGVLHVKVHIKRVLPEGLIQEKDEFVYHKLEDFVKLKFNHASNSPEAEIHEAAMKALEATALEEADTLLAKDWRACGQQAFSSFWMCIPTQRRSTREESCKSTSSRQLPARCKLTSYRWRTL
tara:strand:+ start:460 stop:840 length:381 start_codon:yes stop_codon:yes gene_type:complete